MAQAILTAGGVALPAPVSITVNDEIIWSSDTGRTVIKRRINTVKWGFSAMESPQWNYFGTIS